MSFGHGWCCHRIGKAIHVARFGHASWRNLQGLELQLRKGVFCTILAKLDSRYIEGMGVDTLVQVDSIKVGQASETHCWTVLQSDYFFCKVDLLERPPHEQDGRQPAD